MAQRLNLVGADLEVIPTQISTAYTSALVGDRIVREILTGVAMRRRATAMRTEEGLIDGPSGDRRPSAAHANIRSMTQLRRCERSREVKPEYEFAWKRKARGKRDGFCRLCRAEYGREHYEANRSRYIEKARVQKQRLRLERTA